MSSSRGVAVVTGASSGIGAATARRLAGEGWRVVVAARRLDRLEELAGEIDGIPASLDVTDDDSVESLADLLRRLEQPVDLLVANAGAAFGTDRVDSAKIEDWRRSFELNVIGTLRTVQALLPLLREAPTAQVVVVTSTAADLVYPGGGSYTAAKHAEAALVRTLRQELLGEPIRVCEIAPGMVKTDEFTLNRTGGDEAATARLYEGVDRPLTADDVAECIGFAATTPPHLSIDQMVIRPLAQAAQHLVHRGPLFHP